MASEYGDLLDTSQQAIDLANEEGTQAIAEMARPSADQVRTAAQDLINYTNVLMAKAKTNTKLMEQLSRGDPNYVLSFGKKMVQTRDDYKELMRRVLNFQNIINEFLGQHIQMVYVYVSSQGQAELYKVDNDVEHLKLDKASSKRGNAITGRYKYSKRALSTMEQIINDKYDSTSLDTTFSEVYQRYNISKSKLKMGGAAYILWKENGWDGTWISGQGPLGEAYLNFFINEYLFSGMVESNVRDYMTNQKYGAVNADNTSGLLQGDITSQDIEYGVKMKGAQAFGYMEVIEYAQQMLEVANIEDFLRELKQDLANKAISNLVKPLEGKLDETVSQLIEPMELRIASLNKS